MWRVGLLIEIVEHAGGWASLMKMLLKNEEMTYTIGSHPRESYRDEGM